MQIEKRTTSPAEETTPELRLLRVVERHAAAGGSGWGWLLGALAMLAVGAVHLQ